MAELGKIERPSIESVEGKRKLYCVPSIHPIQEAPEDYKTLFTKFWDEAERQIERLEHAGKVRKVFCEYLIPSGKDAAAALGQINERAAGIMTKKQQEDAEVLAIEREDLLGPFFDWRNCLAVVGTEEVASKVLEFYRESFDRRLKFMLNAIDTGLGSGEAGLLVISDEQRLKLQFPPDIEVFLVTPPAYDDILKWMRIRFRDMEMKQDRKKTGGSQPETE